MNSLERFFKRIASRLLLTPKRLEAVAALDPSHIYVENVRALFGISTGLAERFCEIAVRQGVLEKHVEVRCPNHDVAADAPTEEQLPPTVECLEEIDGDPVYVTYETSRLMSTKFYVLRNEGA
jgi:hypothetical protein